MSGFDEYDISGEEYCKLYERYLQRPVDELVLAAGPVEGKYVLDLCAGSLRLSKRAKELGAAWVAAFDKSAKMMDVPWKNEAADICVIGGMWLTNLDEFGDEFPFDLVVCQQAINYWFNERHFGYLVENVLADGGAFVFNTFSKRPPEKPTVREYQIGGVEFMEVYQLVESTVYHVQMRREMKPHATRFQYITRQEFGIVIEKLVAEGKLHSFEIREDGNTDIYICRKGKS